MEDVERLDALRIHPLWARSALDYKLLGSETPVPAVANTGAALTPVNHGTSSAMRPAPKLIYTCLGQPQDRSGDPVLLPHTDLIRSLREPCEALDFRFLMSLDFLPIIQAFDSQYSQVLGSRARIPSR